MLRILQKSFLVFVRLEFANWKSYNKAKTVPSQKFESSYSLAQFSLTAISLEDAALTKMLPRKIFGVC